MPNSYYFCRDFLNSHDDDDAWVKISACIPEEAAEIFAQRCWGDGDYFDSTEVEVMDEQSKIVNYEVYVEQEPQFHAYKRDYK